MSNITREMLLSDPTVLQSIQERAYFISETNGFTPGRDEENWLMAEEEVLSKLLANGSANGAAPAAKAPRKAAAKKVLPEGDALAPAAAPKATKKVAALPTDGVAPAPVKRTKKGV